MAPDRSGEPSVDDVQYSSDGGTTFTDHPHAGTDTTATITGLTAATSYEVQVSAHNDEGTSDWSASGTGSTGTSANNSPATGAPTITGTAQVGETLEAVTDGIADADGLTTPGYSYQWIGANVDIAGANGGSYTLVDADQGKAIKVRVSFTDDADNEETLTSAATAKVAAKPNSPATGAPTITGTAQVGETLETVTNGIADSNGLTAPGYSYQWLADDEDIVGATGENYVLVDADQGKAIRVRVSFTDDADNEETLTSAATAAVKPAASDSATWSATLTVGSFGGIRVFWKEVGMGKLTSEAFTLDGVEYRVMVLVDVEGELLNLTLDQALPGNFTLQVGETTLSSENAFLDKPSGNAAYKWDDQGDILADGDTVEVSLMASD